MKTFIAMLSLVLLGACAHGTATKAPANPTPVADYYPLQVGNTWTFRVTLLGQTQEQEISIAKVEGGRFTDSLGNVLSIDSFGVRDEKRYLLRTPLEVGTKWNSLVSVSSYERYSIIEAGQNCVVPAGTFENCIVVESRNQAEGEKLLVASMTFAPKVGIVRITTTLEANGKQIPQANLELLKFQLVGQGTPAPAAPAPAR